MKTLVPYTAIVNKKYTNADLPEIRSVVPDINKAFPVTSEINSNDPHVLLLANVDFVIPFSPWSLQKSFIDFPTFTSNTLHGHDTNYITTYKRLRLLEGSDYLNNDNNTVDVVLNFDFNPLALYRAIKRYISTKSNIFVSVVYKPMSAVNLNFMYILAQASKHIHIFRPYMLSAHLDMCIIIGYNTSKISKKFTTDLLNATRIKYDSIPTDFTEYVNDMLKYVDNSRGWLLVSKQHNLKEPTLVSTT